MVISISEMVVNSNKRVRIKDYNEVEEELQQLVLRLGNMRQLKQEVMLNNMSKLSLVELLK